MEYTIKELTQELGAVKEKTVQDLIRFITNRTDDNPNYSLFLGAGCSINSGVRSGGKLVEDWKKEIYEFLVPDDDKEYSSETAEKYLTQEQHHWFDPNKQYSSLFEKKYDLPKQRRAFVEIEVKDKVPSIGYAYLVKLVEQGFFKTMFTTNFDDLINQAFYMYSNQSRPIVCAHDSSINSVTITSSLPKVIKLHGDYLFDDIKSTLTETESLEENMRNKFSEFSKEYGLIVAGYAGNDRSVMDVLNYLLKHDEYLGQGIYWCLRKDTKVSDELRKMLRKDKVYFVLVDGFDELMAEINKSVTTDKHALPFDSMMEMDLQSIMKNIEKHKKQFSNNKTIQSDLEHSEENINTVTKDNFFTTIGKEMETKHGDKEGQGNLSLEEQRVQLRVQQFEMDKKYKEALSEIDENLKTTESIHFSAKLMKWKADIYRKQYDNVSARKTLEKLISYNVANKLSNNVNNYLKLISICDESEEKIKYANKIIEQDAHYCQPLNVRAKAKSKINRNSVQNVYNHTEIVSDYERSIQLNPYIENSGYFSFISYLCKNKNEDPHAIRKIELLFDALNIQDPLNINLFTSRLKYFKENKKDLNDIETYALDIINKNKNPRMHFSYELEFLKIYVQLADAEKSKEKIEQLEKAALDSQDSSDKCEFLYTKAKFFFEKLEDLDTAIEILEETIDTRNDVPDFMISKLCDYYIYNSNPDACKELISKIEDKYIASSVRINILNEEKKYEEIFNEIEQHEVIGSNSYFMSKSYNLLKLNRYPETIELLRPVLDKTSFRDNVLVINYELAKKQIDGSHNLKRLDTRSKLKKRIEAAAAHSLMSKSKSDKHMQECLEIMKELINEDYENYYVYQRFPVFKDIDFSTFRKNKNVQKITKSALKAVA